MMTNPEGPASSNPKLLVSKAWIQWAALVVLFGFFVLGTAGLPDVRRLPPNPHCCPRGGRRRRYFPARTSRKGSASSCAPA